LLEAKVRGSTVTLSLKVGMALLYLKVRCLTGARPVQERSLTLARYAMKLARSRIAFRVARLGVGALSSRSRDT